MKRFSSAGKDRAFRYWKTIAWLLGDVFRLYRRGAILVVMLLIFSLGMRLMALLIVSRYIHLVGTGEGIYIPMFGVLSPGNSYELLVISSFGSLFCFVVSFATKYAGDVRLLRLTGHYELYCIKRAVVTLATYGGHKRMKKWLSFASKLTGSDARYCGLVMRFLIRLIMPFLTAVISIAGLFYLDMVLTSILALLIAACAPVLYKINVRGAQYSRSMELHNRVVGAAKRESAEQLAQALRAKTGHRQDVALTKSFKMPPPVRAAVESYIGRLKVLEESNLLTGLLMGGSIFAILLYKGLEILGSTHGWALIAVYFIVLRVCLGALVHSASNLTSINRMFPQVNRYSSFVLSAQMLRRGKKVYPPDEKFWSGATIGSGDGQGNEEEDS